MRRCGRRELGHVGQNAVGDPPPQVTATQYEVLVMHNGEHFAQPGDRTDFMYGSFAGTLTDV